MGGANHSMLQLILELREKYNINPIILINNDGSLHGLQDKCREHNIQYIHSKFFWFKGKKSIKTYIKYILNYIFFYPIIFNKLKGIKIDIVHSNGSVIDIGAWVSLIKKTKHVWHLREFGDLDFSLYPVFGKIWERKIYKNADCFIAISKAIKEAFSNVIPRNKIILIYNGVSLNNYNRDAYHHNSVLQFVMVGRIEEPKNQLEAIMALSLLVKQGYKAYINFIGSPNKDYMIKLKSYIKENLLDEYVKFWGVRNDVPQILSKMDVGLMLSRCEAFGRVTVEYMLQNLAVIVSNTGANKEIVSDGDTGYVYQFRNIEDLAEKMKIYIEHKETMIEIANKGKLHAINNFNSNQNSDSIYNVYKSLMLNKIDC